MSDLKSLRSLAGRPDEELFDAAAREVVDAWVARADRAFKALEIYAAIFDGIAELPPLVACRLGMEIRARFAVYVPEEFRGGSAKASAVEAIRRGMLERFEQALRLRALDFDDGT